MTNKEKEAFLILKLYKQKLENSCSNLLEDDIKAFDLAIKALENEKPQGEWEKPFLHSDGRWYHKCTNCHICSEVSILQDKYCNFCPNCGADMRGA